MNFFMCYSVYQKVYVRSFYFLVLFHSLFTLDFILYKNFHNSLIALLMLH